MASRWPLNVWLWKEGEWNGGLGGSTAPSFTRTIDDFEEARNFICTKLKNEGYFAGMMWCDAQASPEEARRSGHKLEDLQPQRIELHYRAFDDASRGRIVCGGLSSTKEANEYVAELQAQYAKKVFTPNELYALKPINQHYAGIDRLEKWLGEEEICLHDYKKWEEIETAGLVKLKYLVDEPMGSDESFEIATVWFASNPIAVVTHTGEDNNDRYITNVENFYKMVTYLRSFMVPEEDEKPTMVDPNKPLHWLTELDGYHTIHDYYDVERQEKIEKVKV
jgi:hypothetical protein